MADRKISELTNITGANLADDDEFALVDTSADETKAITFGEFKTALDTATGFVRITGDTMTGNLTVPNVVVSGNVDGRDVSADGTKLDGIEAGADVTDTTNVTAAGALMDSELSNLAAVKAINQGLSTSDSPSFDAVTVGSTSDPSSEMTILSSIGGTSELRLGDTDVDAGSIKYFNSNDQLVLRAAAATRVIFSSTGAAITGKTTTDELDLNAIAATISDTAVDIFVYDTRKDSDGGAWRKRTQHTSWYNETLNTSTRGSRKEFPAVAVIVCRTNTLTIYDGDDPDLPMWMVFNTVGSANTSMAFLGGTTDVISSCSISNGTLVITIGNASIFNGIRIASFVSEKMNHVTTQGYRTSTDISERNTQKDYGNLSLTGSGIVNNVVNDVAMTVLPNAPIDAATGLPVPTIAVATDGGVSVIKDDGTVVDIKVTSTMTGSTSVYFLPDNRIAFNAQQSSVSSNYYRYCIAPIPSSDVNNQPYWQSYADDVVKDYAYSDYTGEIPLFPNDGLGANITAVEKVDNDHAIGGPQSLSLLSESSIDNSSKDLFAYITSDYNTGWMNGDIKLATLSDTDATNVTGSELVTNGDFSSATGWTAQTGWSIDTGAGTASCNGTSGAFLYQTSGFPANTKITISFDITSYTSGSVRAGSTGAAPNSLFSSVGSHSVTYTTSSTNPAGIEMYSISFVGTIDNVSARIIEEDRSVNDNGLQVFGTVTKSAVATGADLVGYSGFSASNYLMQPYNADLDFGTSDFCIMGWNKGTDTAGYLIARNDGSGSTDRIAVDVSSGKYRFYLEAGATGILTSTSDADTNTWTQFCALRRSGTTELYINGKLEASGTSTIDLDNSSCVLHIGDVPHVGNGYYGFLALFRISATAPSPEQIKKIYEDEKVLFQTGAQATLYGSSDAVTALAYDDTTELLHVGTSAGRSVFQGLRRVDNTTTAVGAAISASNGLVADE